jgi:hypothetical protein
MMPQAAITCQPEKNCESALIDPVGVSLLAMAL